MNNGTEGPKHLSIVTKDEGKNDYSDRVLSGRMECSKELERRVAEYTRHMQPDPTGSTGLPDERQVFERENEKWLDWCRLISKRKDPVPVEPDAFRIRVDGILAKQRRQKEFAMGLHEVDLTDYGFTRWGGIGNDRWYLAHNCAVVVSASGTVLVFLRAVGDPDFHYQLGWRIQHRSVKPHVAAESYKLGDLGQLFSLLHAEKPHHATQAEVNAADETPAYLNNLWRAITGR